MRLAIRSNRVDDSEISFLAIIISILILITIAFYTFLYGISKLNPVPGKLASPEADQPLIVQERV
jgi:hypothetical protein